MKQFAAVLATAGLFVYPAVVYFGIQYVEPRLLAGLLLLLLLARFAATGLMRQPAPARGSMKGQALLATLFLLAVILYTLGSNQVGGLKFYPLVISVYLLVSFSYSLVVPPTVIERIARLTDGELSAEGVRYTRVVTLIWCGFFFANSLVILYSIYLASFQFWALYNGFLSYLLIGGLLGGEYLYRVLILKKGQKQN